MRISYIFFYGTLMTDMYNHHYIKPHILRSFPGKTAGRLYHLPHGFPMLTEGKDTILGEIVELRNMQLNLNEIDQLEGYRKKGSKFNIYERVVKTVSFIDTNISSLAYVYVCPAHRVEYMARVGEYVSDGDWRTFFAKDLGGQLK